MSKGVEPCEALTCSQKIHTVQVITIIIIIYIYHVIINALRTHMIHINVNTIFYTHVEHSPTKAIYI